MFELAAARTDAKPQPLPMDVPVQGHAPFFGRRPRREYAAVLRYLAIMDIKHRHRGTPAAKPVLRAAESDHMTAVYCASATVYMGLVFE